MKRWTGLLVILLCGLLVPAQEDNQIELGAGQFLVPAGIHYSESDPAFPGYGLAGFHHDWQGQKLIAEGALDVLDYLSPTLCQVRINRRLTTEEIQSWDLRFLVPLQAEWKCHPLLAGYTNQTRDTVLELIAYFYDFQKEDVINKLKELGAEHIEFQGLTRSARFTLSGLAGLSRFLSIQNVYWVEPFIRELTPNNLVERSNHRVPFVGANSAVYGLTGAGVAIGEWDGTAADQHIDYSFRHFPQEPFVNNSNGRHATHVAGTVLGAGIRIPEAEGMAPGALLYSYDFQGPIPYEMDTSFGKFSLDLTQNSYSYGASSDPCSVRGTYDGTSAALDELTYQTRKLLHVFAAGNSRSSNCKSGGYGTVHSGFQASKNSLVVGAVTSTDANSTFHSYGPVRDGRLKPEACAVGVNVYSTFPDNAYQGGYSGTSMACPGTSGSAALLYEYYYKKYRLNPPANLIKGFMCNGADELGRSGPDYQYGYGRINLRRSAEILSREQFRLDSVSQSGVYTDTIRISGSPLELKLFLCWDDPAASPAAPQALVNDLDLELVDSSGALIKPWVLNPSNFTANAVRGRDSLNNSEQITIQSPLSPYYVLRVRGKRVVAGRQRFSVNWLLQDTVLTVIYPNGGEHWEPPASSATAQIIRWDNYGLSGTAKLEYSLDQGSTWTVIAASIPATTNYYTWNNAPVSIASREALIRVSIGATADQSDSTFHIFRRGPKPIANACNAQLHVKWTAVPNAGTYAIYMHDSGKMKWMGTTRDLFFTLRNLDNSGTHWVAVAAIHTNGAEGPRSEAVPFKTDTTRYAPRFLQEPKDIRVCAGSDTAFSSAVTGDLPLRLFWDLSRNQGADWISTGVSSSRITVPKPALMQNLNLYRIKAVNGCEDTVYSRPALLQVDSSLRFSYSDKLIQLCLGQDTQISVVIQASNAPEYQWFFQKTPSSNIQFLNGRNDILRLSQVSENEEGYYFVQLKNSCGTFIGNVNPFVEVRPPLKLFSNNPDSVCVGAGVVLEAFGTGGDTSAYQFEWRQAERVIRSSRYSYHPERNETWTLSLFDNCSEDTLKTELHVRMRDSLKVDLGPGQLICLGQFTDLKATATGGKSQNYRFIWDDVPDTTSSRRINPAITSRYRVMLDDACTPGGAQAVVEVAVRPGLQLDLVSSLDTQCFGQYTQFEALVSGGKPGAYRIVWNDGDSNFSRTLSPDSSSWFYATLTDDCTINPSRDSLFQAVRKPLKLQPWNAGPVICYGLDTLIGFDLRGGDPKSRTIRWSGGQTATDRVRVRPLISTLYTAILSDGCSVPSDTAQISVEVLEPLKLDVQNARKCAEDTLVVELLARGGRQGSYTFFVDGKPLTGPYLHATERDTTTYRIAITDGCTPEWDSTKLHIFVNTLNKSGFEWNRRVGKKVELSAQVSHNSITWLPGDGSTHHENLSTFVHNYDDYGIYRLCRVESDDFGCSDTSCLRLDLYDPELTSGMGVTINPNPVYDHLIVRWDSIHANIRLEIVDATGRRVWADKWQNAEFTLWEINLSALAQGWYRLNLYSNGYLSTKSFLKI